MSLPILGTCLIASSSDSLLEFINLLMAHQMYSPYGTFLFTTLMGWALGEEALNQKTFIGMLFVIFGVSICVSSKT